MYFFKCFFVFSFVMAYMWCLETMTKTFGAVMEETDINSDSLENNTVRSVVSCGLMCGSNHRCLSFTLCEEAVGWFACRLFDTDRRNNIDTKASKSCTAYERTHGTLAYYLFNFLKSLGVTIPEHLWYNWSKFSQDSLKGNDIFVFYENWKDITLNKIKFTIALKEIRAVRYNSVDVIPKLTKSWFVSFDVKLSETFQISSKNRNILSIAQPDARVNLLGNSKRIYFWSGMNENNTFEIYPHYELNNETFSNVMLVQHLDNIGNYHYRVFINMVEMQDNINPVAKELENMKVYVSDPWHFAAEVIVRNLVYSNLE